VGLPPQSEPSWTYWHAQLSGDVFMSASKTLIPKVLVLAYPKMVMPLSRTSQLELDSIGSDEG
jgi:hypothetical protein